MEQLLAKLTNLGYEFFGVIVPGVVLATFLVLWWGASGPTASPLTFGLLPTFAPDSLTSIVESMGVRTGVGMAISALLLTYFAGHMLLWMS